MISDTSKLFLWMAKLESEKIHFTLTTARENAIMLQVSVPGERWEIEFFSDGTVEAERFRSAGKIESMTALNELIGSHRNK